MAALLLALAELFTRSREKLATVTITALAVGAVAQTAWLIMRWIAAGRAPFSNMFESLVLFVWALVAVYIALQWRKRVPFLAGVTALVAVLVLFLATTFETNIQPLAPALRSRWLAAHVTACFLGYGSVAVAAISGAAYLIVNRRSTCPRHLAGSGCEANEMSIECSGAADPAGCRGHVAIALDAITDKAITFGFLLLTIGIVSGAVWANSAWGSYWSWDPKETWALITWLIYAVYLHARHMRGWHGKRAAWVAVVGFASVIVTYFGVNFLFGGQHSYARAEGQDRGQTILVREQVTQQIELAGPAPHQNGTAESQCRVTKQTS